MDINQIENNIKTLLNSYTEEGFIYGLFSAYGLPNAAVTRLRNGQYNLSKNKNQLLWKKRVCYQIQKTGDLHATIDELKKSPAVTKQHPRFVIVTDFNTLLAIDTHNSDTLDIPLKELSRHFDFFLPWAGMEKSQLQRENPADIKAAERMGRLYDLILEENPIESEQQRHSLNVFFTRLLFCYFAEDTGIFPSGIFVNGIASHTSEDGSDLQSYLFKVFEILNQQDRSKCPAFLAEYPYVNGGLFATSSPVPKFNAKSRKILIECGALNWKAINPDIFGSMMQAVVHTDERSGKGMHYTSVVNIMKVIEPLFLNDLREELENAGENKQKLQKLLDRIYNIRIFDPACGSGNFLIIAYKELCKLEIEIFKRLNPHGQKSFHFLNKLKINQFYGIEIDDFAHETAKLSLWLAEHQMNLAFREVFGEARPTLPLQDGGNIYCGNATRIDWNDICPQSDSSETYILGNPPYIGCKDQSRSQKDDLAHVFKSYESYKKMDYIACWFKLASDYISTNQATRYAFVSTNSICQGEQVALLWPSIFEQSQRIFFAHQSFDWTNNARGKAGVTCVIVGVCSSSITVQCTLFSNGSFKLVKNISPYLIEGFNLCVSPRSEPISDLPKIIRGSQPTDGGHLILSSEERDELLSKYPTAEVLLKEYVGADDFINSKKRYCLWIADSDLAFAMSFPPILERLERCKKFRQASKKEATKRKARTPHRFDEIKHQDGSALLFPVISSWRRKYIPVGFYDRSTVISNKGQVIYGASPFIFGLLSSRMHIVWLSVTSSRFRNDYQYSTQLSYNTFPFPSVSNLKKQKIEENVFRVLEQRELFPEKTIAELYDPETMPKSLLEAHMELDASIDCCYRDREFKDDDERLDLLFRLYDRFLKESPNKGTMQCQISLM